MQDFDRARIFSKSSYTPPKGIIFCWFYRNGLNVKIWELTVNLHLLNGQHLSHYEHDKELCLLLAFLTRLL
jgi:hypothetical protein